VGERAKNIKVDVSSFSTTGVQPAIALVGVGMEFDGQRMIITGLRAGCAAAYSKQIEIGDQLAAVDMVEVRPRPIRALPQRIFAHFCKCFGDLVSFLQSASVSMQLTLALCRRTISNMRAISFWARKDLQ